MTPEKAVKSEVKELLKNNRPAATGAAITVLVGFMTALFLCSTLFTLFTILVQKIGLSTTDDNLSLLLLLLLVFGLFAIYFIGFVSVMPLVMGLTRYSYILAQEGNADYSLVFYYLSGKRYFSSLGFFLRILLRNLWQTIVSFIPAILCFLIATAFAAGEDNLDFSSIMWYYVSYVLVFAGIILFSYITENNFLALYYYIENPDINPKFIFKKSEYCMEKCKNSKTKLNFSLLPRMFLCILIIPCIFVIPFITVSQATSAKWIIALSDKDGI